MRMQVILDSPFARPGSAPIKGGKKGEFRDWTSAHTDGHQRGGQKPTEISVTKFCYKSMNLLLEELKNIKIILFLIQKPFR